MCSLKSELVEPLALNLQMYSQEREIFCAREPYLTFPSGHRPTAGPDRMNHIIMK